MSQRSGPKWLLLIHQIPAKPNYFGVKIGRRLQRLGAAPIKNSVYVLPRNEQAYEDFEWVVREIVEGGGDASVCEARFVEGISDAEVEALFNAAREADYLELADEGRRAQSMLSLSKKTEDSKEELESTIARLRKRLAEIENIDFFAATGRDTVEALLVSLEARLKASNSPSRQGDAPAPGLPIEEVQERTWVTRKGIHVDRMASAWLIRRFIDKDARFKFVPGKAYRPEAGELRFDMFEAEFTHEGDRCTFEVLLQRFGLSEPALKQVAEIVHDIDLKDGKFARTGQGAEGKWVVRADKDSPNNQLLAQESADSTDYRFPLAVVKEGSYKDVSLSVRAKPVSGEVDQGFGIVWRYKDANNYYITRCNADEDNCTIYHTVAGNRRAFQNKSIKVAKNTWHTLKVDAVGNHFVVWFDGQKVLDATDDTFNDAGRAGLWTKADSVN